MSICIVSCVYSDKARMLCAGGEKGNEIKHYGRCCSDTAQEPSFNVYNKPEYHKETCMGVLSSPFCGWGS